MSEDVSYYTERSGKRRGEQRAYTTVILLELHRRGDVNDGGGSATRELLLRARLRKSVAPVGMSNALIRLRADGIVETSVNSTKTYSIRLRRPLSPATFDALKREEAWARAYILKQPLPDLGCPPPEIKLVEDDEVCDEAYIEPDDAGALPETNGHAPAVAVPEGFSVSLDTGLLMQIIAAQAKTISALRAKLG